MKIIANNITNKLNTYLVFKVVKKNYLYTVHPRVYHYMMVGTTTCLLCGCISSKVCDIYTYEDEDTGSGAFKNGLCDKCWTDLNASSIGCDMSEDISESLNKEASRFLKVLQKSKPGKKDYKKIRKYKIQVSKELVEIISCFLIKRSKQQLSRYKAKMLRRVR